MRGVAPTAPSTECGHAAVLRHNQAAAPCAAMPLYLPVADQAAPLTSSLPVPTPSTPSAPGRLPLDVVERLSL